MTTNTRIPDHRSPTSTTSRHMPNHCWRIALIAVTLYLLTGSFQRQVAALPQTYDAQSWVVEAGDVRVRCSLTVGGSFNAATNAISGRLHPTQSDLVAYVGELSVELDTLDTGIGLRNTHLGEQYLEVMRGDGFTHATLSNLHLDEAIPHDATRHDTDFLATLRLHGTERQINGETTIKRINRGLEIEAEFAVSISDYGIAPPRYLGIGVRDEVEITVTFIATTDDAP